MKNFILTILTFFLSFSVFADSNDEDSMYISQALKTTEPSAGSLSPVKKPEIKEPSNLEMTQEKKNTEIDSSYYSVNKFNFLFYLMYKLKYTENENPIEQKTETITNSKEIK
ncbi:hypothetical protein [Reichenbachiella sp. MALMAid0571]|uniref:hypothetical protein n=1 Tax=Reichenbachiella sp. MALMAid0571 TaxID=3143939 RepID=UPI0032DEB849